MIFYICGQELPIMLKNKYKSVVIMLYILNLAEHLAENLAENLAYPPVEITIEFPYLDEVLKYLKDGFYKRDYEFVSLVKK